MTDAMTPLDSGLNRLNQQLDSFLSVLEEEAVALASADSDRLVDLTRQRLAASQQLAESWRQLTSQLGLPANAGLPALRLRAYSDSNPGEAWQRMEKLSHEAARLNRVNGRLIDEQIRRTQTAMQVLQSASSRNLYGSDGRLSDLLNTSRSIDSA
jgi:flagellar biosynthesis/type III secretory pathway chaperone